MDGAGLLPALFKLFQTAAEAREFLADLPRQLSQSRVDSNFADVVRRALGLSQSLAHSLRQLQHSPRSPADNSDASQLASVTAAEHAHEQKPAAAASVESDPVHQSSSHSAASSSSGPILPPPQPPPHSDNGNIAHTRPALASSASPAASPHPQQGVGLQMAVLLQTGISSPLPGEPQPQPQPRSVPIKTELVDTAAATAISAAGVDCYIPSYFETISQNLDPFPEAELQQLRQKFMEPHKPTQSRPMRPAPNGESRDRAVQNGDTYASIQAYPELQRLISHAAEAKAGDHNRDVAVLLYLRMLSEWQTRPSEPKPWVKPDQHSLQQDGMAECIDLTNDTDPIDVEATETSGVLSAAVIKKERSSALASQQPAQPPRRKLPHKSKDSGGGSGSGSAAVETGHSAADTAQQQQQQQRSRGKKRQAGKDATGGGARKKQRLSGLEAVARPAAEDMAYPETTRVPSSTPGALPLKSAEDLGAASLTPNKTRGATTGRVFTQKRVDDKGQQQQQQQQQQRQQAGAAGESKTVAAMPVSADEVKTLCSEIRKFQFTQRGNSSRTAFLEALGGYNDAGDKMALQRLLNGDSSKLVKVFGNRQKYDTASRFIKRAQDHSGDTGVSEERQQQQQQPEQAGVRQSARRRGLAPSAAKLKGKATAR